MTKAIDATPEHGALDPGANGVPGNGEQSVVARTIGEDLREARLQRGEDLATVSRSLKMRPDQLEAIESGRSAGLPGRAYAIGFIRSYADYLGLDPKRSVERYKTEIGAGEAEPQFTYPTQDRRLPGAILIGVLLALALGYGGYHLLAAADRAAEPPVAVVPDRLVAAAERRTPAAPGAIPTPAPAAEQTDTPSDAAAPAAADALPEEAAMPTEIGPEATANAQTPALPAGRAYGTRNGDSRVTLRVHRPTKILVEGADRTLFINRTLVGGDLYIAPNVVGLTLSTPDSGAVEVILDGASLGFLGTRGTIAEGLSLNPQDLVDRTGRNSAG